MRLIDNPSFVLRTSLTAAAYTSSEWLDKCDIMRDKTLAVFSYGKSDAFAPAHNFTDIRKSDFSKLGYNAINGNACTFGGFQRISSTLAVTFSFTLNRCAFPSWRV